MITRFEKHEPLGDGDREALAALPQNVRTLVSGSYIVRDGDHPETCSLLVSGFACRHKTTGEGARQIISIHMRGDFVDLQNIFFDVSDHSVQALSAVELVSVPRSAVRALAMSRPAIARAMWIETLIDASIFREWIVNVGRRDSRTRLAHLLCEFFVRLKMAGLAENRTFSLPLTQEQLADAVGLTPVHVNRVLRAFDEEGLIERDRRSITIVDWDRMREVGDFHERYLHGNAASF